MPIERSEQLTAISFSDFTGGMNTARSRQGRLPKMKRSSLKITNMIITGCELVAVYRLRLLP